MFESERYPERGCALLQQRIALNILLEELAVATLSDSLAKLREAGDPGVPQFECMIRSHRIGILKQRAVMGAAGIEV